MLRVLELFAGIGAASKALENLGIEHEIVDAVEIDKYAIKAFNAIHGTNFEPQDITKWDKNIEVDLLIHGSPCQDYSIAGLQAGGDKGSGTRSSLMYESVRIIEKLRPKYVIWENVKNLLSKKHRHNFEAYLKRMEELGYTNYYQVLNAKDYGIPQNRERIFTVSILGGGDFKFPEPMELVKKLKDVLEDNVDEKYYVSSKQLTGMATTNYESYKLSKLLKDKDQTADTIKARFEGCPQMVSTGGTELQREVCDKALKEGLVKPNDVIEYTFSNARLGEIEKGYIRKQNKSNNQIMSTLKTNPQQIGICVGDNMKPIEEYPSIIQKQGDRGTNNYSVNSKTSYTIPANPMSDRGQQVVEDNPIRIRKLTPMECYRLMGFDDESFDRASKVISSTQLYKTAGNSIVVDVLMAVFRELFNGQASAE